jgi:iron(III) transport system ATP-binding protein
VPAGCLVTVLGPSGSGKTTLLRLIAGLEKPDNGLIRLNNTLVSGPKTLVPSYQRNLGMIFQDLALWPHMTVSEHLQFAAPKSNDRHLADLVATFLQKFHLAHMGTRCPNQLSGGEKQRLAIARAIIAGPQYLLMDEPFSQLDFHLRKQMRTWLQTIQQETRLTIVYVTHNLDEVMLMADDVLVLDKGVVKFYGDQTTFRSAYSHWFNL